MVVAEDIKKKYTTTIGIETHVQLRTATKLFSAVGNDAKNAEPNTLISHIDVGMPGALPVLNKAAIELCARAAFALNTRPQKMSWFERKHYFYPDLPKGYQITQYEAPIIKDGYINVPSAEGSFKVEIERANLEEDAGKNTHPEGADYSLVDLNRAGTPLLEIVSRPDIHSPEQAKQFAREIWLIMKYADVTEGDLYLGHVRFDINVSVSKEKGQLGTRSEIKNLNSFRSVENAAAYEIDRQIESLEKGQKVVQETRGWDEQKQKSTSQRGKEEAHDYRYMPEPDIPPVELDDTYIEKIKSEIPELPTSIREKLNKLSISSKVVEDIINVPQMVNLVMRIIDKGGPSHARRVAFWMMQSTKDDDLISASAKNPIPIEDEKFIKLSNLVEENKLSSTGAKDVLIEMITTSQDPQKIADEKKLIQVSDENEIEKIVEQVLTENKQAAEDVRNGEMKAIGFLVGQVMATSKGQANPQLAQQIIKKQLGLS